MKKLYFILIAILLAGNVGAQSHFTPAFEGNGYDHMNIYIVESIIEGMDMQAGDEIAVFDGDICAGVFTLTEPLIDSTIGFINASRADSTGAGNGYEPGNTISFKLWDDSEATEYDNVEITFVDPESGLEVAPVPFTVGGTVFVRLNHTIKNIGNTDVYSGSGAVNTRRAIPVTFTENGKISSLSIYHHGGSGNLLMGVYLDSSGKPGTRLGVSAPTAINATEGWQEVMLTDSVLVNSGETVWLSFLFENSTVIRVAAGAPGQASSSQGWASGMPSDFGTSSLSNYNFSLYCTYNSTEETIIRDASTNLGNTDVYSGSGAVNTRRAIPVTFTENGKISSLSIYHHGGSGNLLMGVYLDSSGKPGTRLGVSAPTAINATEGWQEVMLTDSVLVNSGETVWLSFLFENSTVIRVAAGAPGQASSSQGWASGMPSDFGTSSLSNYNFSLYCTYNSTEETIIRDASTNLGNTDVYSGSGAVNTRRAIPVTFTENGKISSLSIYHHGGSGNLLMGVYLDSSGKPGTRLGVSAPTAINATEGWQEVMLTDSVLVNSGETVWLSFLFENSTVIRVAAGAPGQASSSQGWASGMPSDFGTSSLSNYNFSLYCTYNSTEETIIRDASTNLGNTDVYSGSGAVNTRRAIPVTFTENGKISSLSIYHHGGSGNLLMGVYLDSSGKPGTRLGVSAPTAINATEGWQEVMLTDSVLVNSGETVWLSFLFENSTVIRVAAGAPGQASSSQGWASGMPSDFGTSSLSNYNFSLYCTYNSTEETIIRDASTNLGNTDVYSGSGAVNTRRAIPVTFTENGKISSLSIYHHGGSGNLLMGVYLDSSGKPGTRLGVSAPTAINATEGWQEVMLTDSVLVNSGETVWLSFLFENSTAYSCSSGCPWTGIEFTRLGIGYAI